MPSSPRYTEAEIDWIRNGLVPPGRKRHAVLQKAAELGVKFEMKTAPKWTPEEIQLLRDNKPIPTRSVHQCYTKAWKLNIEYAPKGKHFREQHALSLAHHDEIIEEVRRTGNIRATGRKYGVSYATVSTIAKKAGLTNNPCPKDRRGVAVIYDGITWVWTEHNGGGYWRETSGKRRNLARYVYEQKIGSIPNGYVVMFRNGDRMDLRPENLELVTKSDQMIRQQKDPQTRAAMLAGAAMGRLSTKIKEKTDPIYREKRYRQRAEVCRQMRLARVKKHS